MSWRFATVLALLLVGCGGQQTPAPRPGPAPDVATADRLLERHRPIYAMDARDRDRPTRVEALISRAVLRDADGRVISRRPTAQDLRPGGRGQVLDGPDAGARPLADAVYGAVRRQAGRTWLQYWAFLPDNPQDRGVLRSGRHEGDWEFAQVGLDASQRPQVLTLAQHKWAVGCPWGRAERVGARPVLYLANGSHATYLRAGEHGRPWPDPDDEARGDGARTDPQLLLLDRQPWRAWAGHWGGSRASGLIPIEAMSPVGPAFQAPDQLERPTSFHDGARSCDSGAPTATRNGFGIAVAAVTAGLVLLWRRRRRRRHDALR